MCVKVNDLNILTMHFYHASVCKFLHQSWNYFPGRIEFLGNFRMCERNKVAFKRLLVFLQVENQTLVHIAECNMINRCEQLFKTTTISAQDKVIPVFICHHPLIHFFQWYRNHIHFTHSFCWKLTRILLTRTDHGKSARLSWFYIIHEKLIPFIILSGYLHKAIHDNHRRSYILARFH